MENQYPGITEQIRKYKEAELPSCVHCGSKETAKVIAGIVGRTIMIAGETNKVRLVPNMTDEMGKYFCNQCKRYFS